MKCDPSGPLMIHCTKVIPRSDAASFYALGGRRCKRFSINILGWGGGGGAKLGFFIIFFFPSYLFPWCGNNVPNVAGRVMSGTLSRHHHVRVLGEQFTLEDDEDSAFADASNLSYACGRYQLPAESVTPGNICLIEGVDSSIAKVWAALSFLLFLLSRLWLLSTLTLLTPSFSDLSPTSTRLFARLVGCDSHLPKNSL